MDDNITLKVNRNNIELNANGDGVKAIQYALAISITFIANAYCIKTIKSIK